MLQERTLGDNQPPVKMTLTLDNGSQFTGVSFGADKAIAGEVVFNTAMMGYPESLTDPSYIGQIMVLTYPLIGNYGVPTREQLENGLSRFMESHRIHPEAIVVSDYSEEYSHWNAQSSLASWLKEENIVGLTGIDTRRLTKLLREEGSMKGKIIPDGAADIPFVDPHSINLVAQASCNEITTYGNGSKRVVLIDCGVKHSIIRCLLEYDVTVIRVPWDYDFTTMDYDGLFISNGPGNPNLCGKTVEHIRKAMDSNKPICGICMGNQLLAKAAGADIYKLKYGHRSHNQPVRQTGTNHCFITSQNHGYAVDNDTLSSDWEALFINMNDGTNEGIRHRSKPFFSAQFHPEACSGPEDAEFLFWDFVRLLN